MSGTLRSDPSSFWTITFKKYIMKLLSLGGSEQGGLPNPALGSNFTASLPTLLTPTRFSGELCSAVQCTVLLNIPFQILALDDGKSCD